MISRHSIVLLLLVGLIDSTFGIDGLYLSNSSHILFQPANKLTSGATQPTAVYGNNDSRIVGLAVDVDDGLVFWSDISFGNSGIYKGEISGSGELENVEKIVSDVGEVNGIAVDWHSNHIYWTDCNRHSIELAEYDGSNRVVLSIDGLESPRGIYADPMTGFLFWNDQGTKKIERSMLDGSKRQDVATSDVELPNQMAVKDGYLYTVDGGTLKVVRYTIADSSIKELGSARHFGANSNTNYPFGLAVDENFVYVSIWYTGKVVQFALSASNEDEVVVQALGVGPLFSLAYYSSSNQPTVTSDPCSSKGCDQICLPTGLSSARCTCSSFGGETLQADGKTCSDPSNLLFYVLADEGIVAFKDLDGAADQDRSIVGRSLRPVAVAYDPVDGFVYWSDVYERTIHMVKLDGTEHSIFMSSSSHSIGVVDGLAVDPVRRNLYYSNLGSLTVLDNHYSWHRIEFIGLDGTGRKTIVDDVEMPRGLHLDYTNGHLYYTDWGSQPSIIRVDLDGSNAVILGFAGLDNPNSLTIIGDKVYAVDSHYNTRDKDRNPNYPGPEMDGALYSVNKDGTGWTEVNLDNIETPFGLTSYNGKLYVSDWAKKAIYEVTPGGQPSVLMSDVVDPMDLFFSPRTMEQGTDQCSSESCEEVCVVSDGTATCACDSYNGNIFKDSTCTLPDYFILTGDFNTVKLIDLSVEKAPGEEVRDPQILIEGGNYFSNFVSLAYDTSNKKLYYTDVNRQSIYRADIEDPENGELFYSADKIIDGMDLDGGKLYWTAFVEGAIYSTAVSDNTTEQLITGLSRPRAIKVRNNYIYWTEWGSNPAVKRASTDGSDTQVLVDGLLRPNGLDVDSRNLYIGDSDDEPEIQKCDLDGSVCAKITVTGDAVKHIYSIEKEANRIYYTDWVAGTLSFVLLNDDGASGRVIHLAEHLMRPTEFILETGIVKNQCPDGHGCEGTCSPYPGGSVCSCPDNQFLGNDGKSCKSADELPCVYDQSSYKVGESFSPETCVSCLCDVDRSFGNPEYGGATCNVMTCPEPSCDKAEQVRDTDECCPRCREGLCATTPITIEGCQPGTFKQTITLGSTENTATRQFEFEGFDNCAAVRDVTVTNPGMSQFPWKSTPYELQARAEAPSSASGGGLDTFICDIELTIEDVTSPTITCPNDASYYYDDDRLLCSREPVVEDNVCGTDNQDACIIEGVSCQQLSIGTHSFTYTARDLSGNQQSCSFTITIEEDLSGSPCDAFNVQNGNVDCTEDACTITCDSSYSTNLLGGNTVFTCLSNGSFSPATPIDISTRACSRTFNQRIIVVDRVRSLPCPRYSTSIVTSGLRDNIRTDYISSRDTAKLPNLVTVHVIPSGCEPTENKRKAATDDFGFKITLSTEFTENDNENVTKQALLNLMGDIREDIIDGDLLLAPEGEVEVEVGDDNFDVGEAERQCLSGEINNGNNMCTQCPIGTKARNDECQSCPLNEYNDKEGSVNCKVCPQGKITKGVGSVHTSQCFPEDEGPATTAEPVGKDNTLLIIIVAVVAVVVVIITVIVVALIICCRNKNKNPTENKDNDKIFDNPVFKGDDVYEEPPFVADDLHYQGLSQKSNKESNLYNQLNEVNGNASPPVVKDREPGGKGSSTPDGNGSSSEGSQKSYMEPIQEPVQA